MSAVSQLSERMAPLLAKYTPEQIAELLDVVARMQPVADQRVAAPTTPSAPVIETPQRKKRSKKTAASKVALNSGAASARSPNHTAPTRPLNSWMAFRSFHAPIFKSFQQKSISGFLTLMWQNDPFKAKWSILAKAYSTIREHKAKDEAPLDVFLTLTSPHIGIIPKEEYLSVMGWELVEENDETRMENRFVPDITSFPDHILTTNLSAEEIVAFCYHVNYVNNDGSNIPNIHPATATLTMAAQPANSTTQSLPSPSVQPNVFTSSVQPQQDQGDSDMMEMIQALLNENNDGAAGESSALRQTVHDLSGQQYPFNNEFDPYAEQSLAFDPFAGNHDTAFSTGSLGTYLAPSDVEFPENFNVDDFLNSEFFDLNK